LEIQSLGIEGSFNQNWIGTEGFEIPTNGGRSSRHFRENHHLESRGHQENPRTVGNYLQEHVGQGHERFRNAFEDQQELVGIPRFFGFKEHHYVERKSKQRVLNC
jgi:hypothetical protein